jgi:hypothetical protein
VRFAAFRSPPTARARRLDRPDRGRSRQRGSHPSKTFPRLQPYRITAAVALVPFTGDDHPKTTSLSWPRCRHHQRFVMMRRGFGHRLCAATVAPPLAFPRAAPLGSLEPGRQADLASAPFSSPRTAFPMRALLVEPLTAISPRVAPRCPSQRARSWGLHRSHGAGWCTMTLRGERRTSRPGLLSPRDGLPHAGSHQALHPTPPSHLRRDASDHEVRRLRHSRRSFRARGRPTCSGEPADHTSLASRPLPLLPCRPSEDGGAGPARLQGLAPPTSP